MSISRHHFAYFGLLLWAGALAVPARICRAQTCPSNTLYVSSDFAHEVLRYDATTGQFLDTFIPSSAGTGLNQPHGILDRGSDVLVASFGTDSVLRFDRDTGALQGPFIDSTSGLNDPQYWIPAWSRTRASRQYFRGPCQQSFRRRHG